MKMIDMVPDNTRDTEFCYVQDFIRDARETGKVTSHHIVTLPDGVAMAWLEEVGIVGDDAKYFLNKRFVSVGEDCNGQLFLEKHDFSWYLHQLRIEEKED